MKNPYAEINWDTVLRVGSASHMHMVNQEQFENGYKHGLRHFQISNYYPSVPYKADTKLSDFKLRQHWPVNWNGEEIEPAEFGDTGNLE